jgi:hypothetical protein
MTLHIGDVDFEQLREAQGDTSRHVKDWKPLLVLPATWTIFEVLPDGAQYVSRLLELGAILSCARENDGRAWLHLSVSHARRIPNWRELVSVKEMLLGEREAYQVVPPKARYVNINPNVLHLFALLDETATALPDFTGGTGSL